MNLLIYSGYVADLPHRDPDMSRIAVGDKIELVLDPHNQYDPSAIKVMDGEQFIGFIPRESTPVLHEAFANGLKTQAKVMEVTQVKWKEVLIHVRVST